MNIQSLLRAVSRNSPAILTGLGAVGVVTTSILAVKATISAVKKVEKLEDFLGEKATPKDIVHETWDLYVPPVIMGSISIACIVGANRISSKRAAVLAGLYRLSESSFSQYKAKVVEVLGAKKEEAKITGEIEQDKLNSTDVREAKVLVTGRGKTLFFDAHSGRYFEHDVVEVHKIENLLNRRMLTSNYITLNDVYYELGLENVENGDLLGWAVEKGFIEFRLSAKLAKDDTPCVVLSFSPGMTPSFS